MSLLPWLPHFAAGADMLLLGPQEPPGGTWRFSPWASQDALQWEAAAALEQQVLITAPEDP
jgi:hypothetical protein